MSQGQNMAERVAILGASDDRTRTAFDALHRLRSHGHTVLPVNPRLASIDGVVVAPTLAAVPQPIDTITVYVRPALSEPLFDDIVAARPRRVIFNPGSESESLRSRLEAANIPVQWECTLVLLRTGRF